MIQFQKWGCNKIFLATEDINYVASFKNFFGDICVTLEREYLDYNPNSGAGINAFHLNRENDHFILGKDYLTQIAILSKCNSLVASRTNGTAGALMMADKIFENIFIFNLGRYGVLTPYEIENY